MTKKEYVDFNIIREDYSEYHVENGQILKVKQLLTEIINVPDKNDKLTGKCETRIVSIASTPIEIDTSDLEESTPDKVTADDEVKELKFKVINEPINFYETGGSIILMISNVVKVFATKKKEKNGNPIIRFRANYGVKMFEKPKMPDESSPVT